MAKCDMDCFNCQFPDCINDKVYSEKQRYCNRSEEYKIHQIEYQKKRYQQCKEQGICTQCKKNKATHGVKCYECWLKRQAYVRKHRSNKQEIWKSIGKCYFCGNDPIKGKKVCAKHYEMGLRAVRHMLESPNTKKAQKRISEWHWKLREANMNPQKENK